MSLINCDCADIIEASLSVNQIVNGLLRENLSFILRYNKATKHVIITGVKDADLIKHFYPQFQIKKDTRQQRFVELTINYE